MTALPFVAFNFSVEISVDGGPPLCDAAFAECDGLELNQELKTIREGGNNGRQIRMAGPVTYGVLTLKRGITDVSDLWDWFERSVADPSLTADAEVTIRSADALSDNASWTLGGCRPLKLKAPPLNAKDGVVAVEELQVAYETLTRQPTPGS
jgi:phage tail-like protein